VGARGERSISHRGQLSPTFRTGSGPRGISVDLLSGAGGEKTKTHSLEAQLNRGAGGDSTGEGAGIVGGAGRDRLIRGGAEGPAGQPPVTGTGGAWGPVQRFFPARPNPGWFRGGPSYPRGGAPGIPGGRLHPHGGPGRPQTGPDHPGGGPGSGQPRGKKGAGGALGGPTNWLWDFVPFFGGGGHRRASVRGSLGGVFIPAQSWQLTGAFFEAQLPLGHGYRRGGPWGGSSGARGREGGRGNPRAGGRDLGPRPTQDVPGGDAPWFKRLGGDRKRTTFVPGGKNRRRGMFIRWVHW